MKWEKKGLIYNVAHFNDWAYSHVHKPSVVFIDENRLRIFFGVRDKKNITRTTFIDVNPENPKEILYEHDKPVLDVGKLGAFDDSGVNVSCVLKNNGLYYMYFIGWNPSKTVSTRNAIGLATSKDGVNFTRMFDGAVLDRTALEPYYTGAVYVIIDEGIWKMWYTSGSEFKVVNEKPEIWYHIKYAESADGIKWRRDNIYCIKPKDEYESTARPCVIKDNGIYKMWYSYRSICDFRTDVHNSYRIGYAESKDGKNWTRKDEEVGIGLSKYGWDSNMIAYPAVYKFKGKTYMLYNGNDFGASGFGYAELIDE